MKNYSTSFLAVLHSEVVTLATCWLIELGNGDKIGFTDCDRPFTIDGVYYDPDGGFEPSDVSRGLDTDSNSMMLKSYFSSQLPESVVCSGQLRSARVFVFRVNPYELPDTLEDDPLTYDPIHRGMIRKLELTDQTYSAELGGLADLLSRTTGDVIQSTCRNDFCDVNGTASSSCGLDISDYTDSRTVTEVINPTVIQFGASVADNHYAGAEIIWQSGDNLGLKTACWFSNGQRIFLTDRMPNAIAVGDDFTITQVCGKGFSDCHRYGNISHFNGEPKIPGQNAQASLAPQN
jgi:uncharacterized phage protein (TIGR02218 family)